MLSKAFVRNFAALYLYVFVRCTLYTCTHVIMTKTQGTPPKELAAKDFIVGENVEVRRSRVSFGTSRSSVANPPRTSGHHTSKQEYLDRKVTECFPFNPAVCSFVYPAMCLQGSLP